MVNPLSTSLVVLCSAGPTLVIGAVWSWLLLRALVPQLRQSLLDHPNDRSSHCVATPRAGGLAFVFVTTIANLFELASSGWSATEALPVILLPLSFAGFLDDHHNLPTSWRYGVQLATAVMLVILSPLQIPWLLFPLMLITVTAVINFTNFMDGLDGLVAGCMVVALSSATLVLGQNWYIWALVGALMGFLVWNWNPAKVFMGDVGSTFLGAMFAGLVLQASNWLEAMEILLVATPLLGDACLCVPRRLLAGQKVFQAHRLHLFQRLHQAGWHHDRVACLYISATVAMGISLLLGGWPWVLWTAAIELLIGVWLDQTIAVPFSVASKG